ncbi:MAG: hypothetical protein CMD83_18070 [Gammaproteobacteria bacterium]|nr:hypothetical protein [Gammaproteobacteria bacterium]
MRANRAHKIMKGYMNEVFESSPEFAQAFAYEAMTGRYKFGSSAARAEYMLNVDWDGVPAIWEKPELDSAYTKAVANKMNLSVRFKTTSRKVGGVKTGEYKYWSVVGLVVNKMNEQLEDYDGDLNEGIADILRSAWNKIKGWVSNLLKNVIEYVKQSPKRIMDFLGIEPELEFAGTEENPINLLDLE